MPFDADETGLARLLMASYPERLLVEQVINTGHTRPLAAAAEAARFSGLPTFNPSNQPWLSAIRRIAAENGSRLWFMAGNGNAAFSSDHMYAADYALRRGRLATLAGMGRDIDGRWSSTVFRSRVLGPLRRSFMAEEPTQASPLHQFRVGSRGQQSRIDRHFYVDWLAQSTSGLPAMSNPAVQRGVLVADPFTARSLLEVASAILPEEWQQGGVSRGFARRAGEGRVPDAIRLRTRRGQQGRDAWYVIRNDHDEYLERIASLPTVPGLEHVDHRGLGDHVAAWPWGQVQGPYWPEQVALDRLLALADFATTIVAEPAADVA
jgi:hypothetical protein